ncbi:hypothetical protein LCGC14_1204210 [marine sediment metagenome]|uniref:Uncharacterized protein n=1 Tax=marine sediment metagenome TaxID=412755 RepID=A0A0F9NYD9_9ZZZZ
MSKRVSDNLKQALANYAQKPLADFTKPQLTEIVHALLNQRHGPLTETERNAIMVDMLKAPKIDAAPNR